MGELKHCPFCGSKEIVVSDSGSGMYAYCKSCYAIGTHFSYDGDKWSATSEAIDAWNARYEPICHFVENCDSFKFRCDNCGYASNHYGYFNYCPGCGRKVQAVD